MKAYVATMVALLITAAAGAVPAANGDVPGDPIQGMSRATERIDVELTEHPNQAVEQGLGLAEDEDLTEKQPPAETANADSMGGSVPNQQERELNLAQAASAAAPNDQEPPAATPQVEGPESPDDVNDTDGPDPDDDEGDDGTSGENGEGCRIASRWCAADGAHPFASALAQQHTISYTDVISWFCGSYGMGEIELALQTGAHTSVPA